MVGCRARRPRLSLKALGLHTDIVGMKHIIADVSDVPPLPPAMERRCTPDRRVQWRGGRRDSDWTNRPPDALARLEAAQKVTGWKRALLGMLHLW